MLFWTLFILGISYFTVFLLTWLMGTAGTLGDFTKSLSDALATDPWTRLRYLSFWSVYALYKLILYLTLFLQEHEWLLPPDKHNQTSVTRFMLVSSILLTFAGFTAFLAVCFLLVLYVFPNNTYASEHQIAATVAFASAILETFFLLSYQIHILLHPSRHHPRLNLGLAVVGALFVAGEITNAILFQVLGNGVFEFTCACIIMVYPVLPWIEIYLHMLEIQANFPVGPVTFKSDPQRPNFPSNNSKRD